MSSFSVVEYSKMLKIFFKFSPLSKIIEINEVQNYPAYSAGRCNVQTHEFFEIALSLPAHAPPVV